jgi:hypothetical protein
MNSQQLAFRSVIDKARVLEPLHEEANARLVQCFTMGGPEGLNTQAHSEQPHPITLSSLIHTVLRDEQSWPGVGTPHKRTAESTARNPTQ